MTKVIINSKKFLNTGWREKKRQPLIRETVRKGMEDYRAFFQIGVDRGEFRPLLPLETICRVLSAFVGGLISHLFHLGAESIDLPGQMKSIRLYLKHMLQVQDPIPKNTPNAGP